MTLSGSSESNLLTEPQRVVHLEKFMSRFHGESSPNKDSTKPVTRSDVIN